MWSTSRLPLSSVPPSQNAAGAPRSGRMLISAMSTAALTIWTIRKKMTLFAFTVTLVLLMIKQHFALGGNYSLWEVHVPTINYYISFFLMYLATEKRSLFYTCIYVMKKSYFFFLLQHANQHSFPWAYKILELDFSFLGKFDRYHQANISLVHSFLYIDVCPADGKNALLRHHSLICCSPCTPAEKIFSSFLNTEVECWHLHSLVIP